MIESRLAESIEITSARGTVPKLVLEEF
jgi:hypothetical protein